MGQIYNSESISMSTAGGSGGPTITHITSGQSLDPLTAAPGIYYLETGAILNNGPQSVITEMYIALVTVRVTGVSVNLTAYCHFNVSSGYLHYGEWELMAVSGGGGSYDWSNVGPGESSNPAAGQGYTIKTIPAATRQSTASSMDSVYPVYLAGKVYGLLTPEEDQALEDYTKEALTEIRAAGG
ncbi:hypothetical protein NB069_08820 [Leclercia adecarboxylata]|uniref:hypothetical protein n=1 Tax=Leclercia adecarboxylata TaxID=83655 RepID=UPI002029F5DB|nr:hypothetical protein [Leclercia adecarboxylata]URO00951.1 hypothetical protein NB069_08820 [Leclercia adecarboxylata]